MLPFCKSAAAPKRFISFNPSAIRFRPTYVAESYESYSPHSNHSIKVMIAYYRIISVYSRQTARPVRQQCVVVIYELLCYNMLRHPILFLWEWTLSLTDRFVIFPRDYRLKVTGEVISVYMKGRRVTWYGGMRPCGYEQSSDHSCKNGIGWWKNDYVWKLVVLVSLLFILSILTTLLYQIAFFFLIWICKSVRHLFKDTSTESLFFSLQALIWWQHHNVSPHYNQTRELFVPCPWWERLSFHHFSSCQPSNNTFAEIPFLWIAETEWNSSEFLILGILFCSLHPTILFWLSQIIGITGETNGMLRDWFRRVREPCRSLFPLFVPFLRPC